MRFKNEQKKLRRKYTHLFILISVRIEKVYYNKYYVDLKMKVCQRYWYIFLIII